MTFCIGVRGATQSESNASKDIYDCTRELLEQMIEQNDIIEDQVAAAFFTVTNDLNAAYPAAAARQLGWNNTALMCSTEIPVPDYPDRCVRVLIMIDTDKPKSRIVNVYLKDTVLLRQKGLDQS